MADYELERSDDKVQGRSNNLFLNSNTLTVILYRTLLLFQSGILFILKKTENTE